MQVWRLHSNVIGATGELADMVEMRLAGGTGEQAVVADTVEALGQDVEQEAADEFVGRHRHDLLPVGALRQ